MNELTFAKTSSPSKTAVKKRVVPVPSSITGFYRLSVKARSPFCVDIGGRNIGDVRSLEIFHAVPMYLDSAKNLSSMEVWGPTDKPARFRIHVSGGRAVKFRVTADEVMPEQIQMSEQVEIASINAKMPYDGLARHVRKMREERNPKLAYHFVDTESPMAEVVHEVVSMGVAYAWVAPFALSLMGLAYWAVLAMTASMDPWRTYINGQLYKNLKDVKVRLHSGEINGYMTP